jgi:type II secretory pathway pseudopilin PulG
MVERDHGKDTAGFLLIEVVVALVIVGLAFAYGFRSLSGAVDRLGRDYNSSAALLLAQSTLDRVGYDIALGQDDLSGKTAGGFSWLIQTAAYAAPAAPNSSLVGYIVRVTVGWSERGNNRQVQLATVRLAYRAPPQ